MADYNKLKVVELKDLLKQRGISATGLTKKAQYIQALTDEDSKAEGAGAAGVGEGKGEGGGGGDAVDAGQSRGADVGEETPEVKDASATGDENVAAQADEAVTPTQATVPEDAQPADPTAQEPVLESHLPVAEPVAVDATPDDALDAESVLSSDSRKRKRRSTTPPVSQESVQKKLKAVEDAPVAVAEAEDAARPSDTSNDAVEASDAMDTTMGEAEAVAERPELDKAAETIQTEELKDDDIAMDEPVSRSVHPPTAALYIRDLMRPLQPQSFRSHVVSLATPPSQDPDDSTIKLLHLDSLKTHAFVHFSSTASASRARSGLHARVWPEETQRKPLWVDFIPEDKVRGWIDEELDAGKDRRFEVVYSSQEPGEATAALRQVDQPPAPGRQPSSSTQGQGQGQGVPGAPIGPRANRPVEAYPSPGPAAASTSAPRPAAPPSSKPQSSSFNKLDSRFQSTTARPKLYYQQVDDALADRRLAELDRETSRDWQGGRAWNRTENLAPLDQLRRYTFEDGHRVVDGGLDFGGFGRRQGAGGSGRPPPYGGGGGGGGGRRFRP